MLDCNKFWACKYVGGYRCCYTYIEAHRESCYSCCHSYYLPFQGAFASHAWTFLLKLLTKVSMTHQLVWHLFNWELELLSKQAKQCQTLLGLLPLHLRAVYSPDIHPFRVSSSGAEESWRLTGLPTVNMTVQKYMQVNGPIDVCMHDVQNERPPITWSCEDFLFREG